MRRHAFALVGLVLLTGLLGGAWQSARAQTPLPPVPPPPGEVTPVFEALGPAATPVCNNAEYVAVSVPTAGTPDQVIDGVGYAQTGVFTLCGAVPGPKVQCALDEQAQQTISTAGAPPGRAATPVAVVVGETIIVEDNLPPPAPAQPVSPTLIANAQCQPVVEATASPDEEADATGGGDFSELNDFSDAGSAVTSDAALAPDVGSTPFESGFDAGSAAAPAGSTGPTLDVRPARPAGRLADIPVGFAYPAVFAVPFLLLALCSYLGWVLLRPVDLVTAARRR